MVVRPTLRPGLRLTWRGPTTMQVGVAPGPAVVLAGVRAGDEVLLSALDGTRGLAQLQALAHEHDLGPGRVAELVGLLARAGLLMSADHQQLADRVHLSRLGAGPRRRLAPDTDALSLVHGEDGVRLVADRGRRHVQVVGGGRVGALVATTLVAAGVGLVEALDRSPSARPGAPTPSSGPSAGAASGRPHAVVLVGEHVLDPRAGAALSRRDVPHLGLLVATDRVVVGPMVLPGSSACLHCLDLHRRDRDPLWLQVMAQLLLVRPGRARPVGETALSTMASGLATLQVLTLLDGQVRPDAVGRTLELSLPHGVARRRSWSPHPACGCSRLTPDPDPQAPIGPDGWPASGAAERAWHAGQTMGS